MAESTLNGQIVDSVASMNFINNGSSPASSQAMLNAVMAESLGMAMHNAVMRQQANSMVSSAATTAACAKMLQARSNGAPPMPPFVPVPVPDIPPLDGPNDGATIVARSEARAMEAIGAIEDEVVESQQTGTIATSALSGISSAIKGFMGKHQDPAPTTTPTPTPAPTPAPPAPGPHQ